MGQNDEAPADGTAEAKRVFDDADDLINRQSQYTANGSGPQQQSAFQFSVLTTKNLIATKTIFANGKKAPSHAKHFLFKYCELDTLEAFAGALVWLADQPNRFIIRGQLKPGLDPTQRHLRRLYSTSDDPATIECPDRSWIVFDFDGVKVEPGMGDPGALVEVGYFVRDHLLPLTFHQTKCIASVTASTGLKGPDVAHLRLFFKLSDPADNAALLQWCEALAKERPELALDPSVMRPIQEIFTARPVFVDGADPVPSDKRVVILDGPAKQIPTSYLLGSDYISKPAATKSAPRPIPLELAVPEWMLPLLERDAGQGIDLSPVEPSNKACRSVERIYDELKYCGKGERNDTLRKAGWELACLVAEGELPEAAARDAYFDAAAGIPNDDNEYPDKRIEEMLNLAFDKVFCRRK